MALPCPLFTLGRVLEGLPWRIASQELYSRSPGYFPVVARLDAVPRGGTPGRRLRARLYRAGRVACSRVEGIGPIPNSVVLGATCQIQGYTLHLAVLATFPFFLSVSVISLLGG